MSSQPKESGAEKKSDRSTDADSLKSELDRVVGQIIPEKQRAEVVRRVERVLIHRQEQFQGPIPHPNHLKQYEEICPGAADRLIKMAEAQQQAEIDALALDQANEADDRKRGLRFGFAAFSILVLAAAACAYFNQPWLGGAFLATSAVSAVAVFVNGRK